MQEYSTGKLHICFLAENSHVKELLENGFDTLVLWDSLTESRVELEVADLWVEQLEEINEEDDVAGDKEQTA